MAKDDKQEARGKRPPAEGPAKGPAKDKASKIPTDPLVVHGGRESVDDPRTLDPDAIEFHEDPNAPVSLDDSAIHSMGDTDSLDSIEDLPFPDDDLAMTDSGERESMVETVPDIPMERRLQTTDRLQDSDELAGTESFDEESATFVYEMSLEISFDPEEEEESIDEMSLDGQDYSPLLEIPSEKARHRQVLSKTIVHNMARHLKRLGMGNRQFRELKATYYRERDRADVSTVYFCSRDEPFLVAVVLRYRGSFLSGVDVKTVFECPRTSQDLGVPPGTTDYYSVRRPGGQYAYFYGYAPEIRDLGTHTGLGSFVQRGITQYVVDCYSFAMAQGMDFGTMSDATLRDGKYDIGDPHTSMRQLQDFARVVADT